MKSSDCWRCFGSPVSIWPFLPPNQHRCSPAKLCCLVLDLLSSPLVCAASTPETLSLHQHCATWSAGCPPAPWACCSLSMLLPWAGRETRGSETLLTLDISCSVVLLFRERLLCFWREGVSVCTLLAWNFPHQLPTKALEQQCPFPTAHLEKTLGLRWWKHGPIFSSLLSPLLLGRDRAVAGCMQI